MTLETDYLVVGAGLAGLAFADALVSGSDATITIVDRQHAPGGHWLRSYPFVRLHQPSRLYGVASTPLGQDRIVTHGIDAGLYERATGAEICGYFDQLMQQRLLASGRVTYLPGTDYLIDGRLRSRLSGAITEVKVRRRLVDATYLESAIPATSAPPFAVAEGVRCVPAGDVVELEPPREGYVVIGAGKTAMDTCQWLLEHGIDPDRIRWIRPRDLWLLNREHYQGGQFVTGAIEGAVLQLEAAARSDDLDAFFERCGESKVFLRLDPHVRPSMIRGATSHEREMALLRTIEQVIRLGHVERIEADRIVLERGEVPTSSGWLHVHCAAEGVPRKAPRAIFQADRITMQHVRLGSPSFSYGLVGFLEASGRDDTEKNRLCLPNAFVHTARDWVRSTLQTFACQMPWRKEPDLAAWLDNRLNLLQGRADAQNTSEGEALGKRFSAVVGPGIAGMQRLVAGASAAERALFWPPANC